MAGDLRFGVSVFLKNPEHLPEVQGRIADLTPAFQAIIKEWAELNQQKFGAGKGAEEGGASIDDGVFWGALTPGYMRQKRKAYPDWLMVRTGSLMESMTNPDQLFQAISGQDAVFGTPLDPEDAAKVAYNWTRRQVIFLGGADKNMIRRIVKDYLSLGRNFADIRQSKGFEAVSRRTEEARMDMDFTNTLRDGDGSWGDA